MAYLRQFCNVIYTVLTLQRLHMPSSCLSSAVEQVAFNPVVVGSIPNRRQQLLCWVTMRKEKMTLWWLEASNLMIIKEQTLNYIKIFCWKNLVINSKCNGTWYLQLKTSATLLVPLLMTNHGNWPTLLNKARLPSFQGVAWMYKFYITRGENLVTQLTASSSYS